MLLLLGFHSAFNIFNLTIYLLNRLDCMAMIVGGRTTEREKKRTKTIREYISFYFSSKRSELRIHIQNFWMLSFWPWKFLSCCFCFISLRKHSRWELYLFASIIYNMKPSFVSNLHRFLWLFDYYYLMLSLSKKFMILFYLFNSGFRWNISKL